MRNSDSTDEESHFERPGSPTTLVGAERRFRAGSSSDRSLVVQLDCTDGSRWHDYRHGTLIEADDGWRDDANLLVISPSTRDQLFDPSSPIDISRIMLGAADEAIDRLPPFDLEAPALLVDCPVADLMARFVLDGSVFGTITADAEVVGGVLQRVNSVTADESDHGVDVTMRLPFGAFLALRAGLTDLPGLASLVEFNGNASFLFLLVALLDCDGLRTMLGSRPNSVAALAVWNDIVVTAGLS